MKLKLSTLIFLLTFSVLTGKAQVYTGGSFSILNKDGILLIDVSPELGYNLNNKWALGGKLSYHHIGGGNIFSFTPYGRLTFFEKESVSLFADGGIDFYWSDPKMYYGAGIIPGILFKTGTNLSFFAKYGYIGYSDTPLSRISGISLSSNNLSIGVYYNF